MKNSNKILKVKHDQQLMSNYHLRLRRSHKVVQFSLLTIIRTWVLLFYLGVIVKRSLCVHCFCKQYERARKKLRKIAKHILVFCIRMNVSKVYIKINQQVEKFQSGNFVSNAI